MNNILCQRIGIYARLSVRNTEREEMSIENQLLLVGQYLDQHTECQQRKVYVDYGYSGANFQRPEFQQMIEDLDSFFRILQIPVDLSTDSA